MAIYKDCTLGEMLFVGGCTLLSLSISLSVITKLIFNFAWIGFTLSILSLVHVTRFLLGRLQKIKYGKPHGYYQQLLLKKLQKNLISQSFLKLSYVQREGKWSVRRMQ
jgi:conjugative transfer region protein (TIGR03750 family)